MKVDKFSKKEINLDIFNIMTLVTLDVMEEEKIHFVLQPAKAYQDDLSSCLGALDNGQSS